MSDSSYKISITLISLFSAFVLIIGCVFSFMPTTSIQPESIPVQQVVTQAFNPIIDTSYPESYDSLIGSMIKLRNEYPNTLKIFTAGYSEQGREMLMFTMGKGEKKVLITGAIHAREHITTKYVLRCVEDYCYIAEKGSGFLEEYNIKELLNEYTLYIIPCINPDGLEIVSGRETAKSDVTIYDLSEYKANANGVDLNRNFPLAWEYVNNGVIKPYTHFFKGYTPASESETLALMKLCEENNFEFLLSIHIKGNLIYWGDNWKTDNLPTYKAFAENIATRCSMFMTEPTQKPKNFGGGFENWFRHTYNRPGLCVELTPVINMIKPCDSTNYENFNEFVKYENTKFVIASALAYANQ